MQINQTDLEVSTLCLGGGCFGSKLNEKKAFEVLDRYVEMGGNFIDTAKVYCGWIPGMERISETLIGKWLKEKNDCQNIVVATKGAHYEFSTPRIPRVSREEVRMDLDESRKILGLDTIDFYWLHRDNESKDIGEIVDFMEELVQEGKIRYYGASNYSIDRLKAAADYASKHGKKGFSAVSNQWSLASKREDIVEKEKKESSLVTTSYEQYCWHKETKMPLIPYSSTAEGFFYKMYQEGRRIDTVSKIHLDGTSSIYWTDRNLLIYNDLLKLNKELGLSFITMSIAYLLSQPFQVFPVCGVSDIAQLDDLIKGTQVKLPEEMIRRWQSLL